LVLNNHVCSLDVTIDDSGLGSLGLFYLMTIAPSMNLTFTPDSIVQMWAHHPECGKYAKQYNIRDFKLGLNACLAKLLEQRYGVAPSEDIYPEYYYKLYKPIMLILEKAKPADLKLLLATYCQHKVAQYTGQDMSTIPLDKALGIYKDMQLKELILCKSKLVFNKGSKEFFSRLDFSSCFTATRGARIRMAKECIPLLSKHINLVVEKHKDVANIMFSDQFSFEPLATVAWHAMVEYGKIDMEKRTPRGTFIAVKVAEKLEEILKQESQKRESALLEQQLAEAMGMAR